MKKPLLSEMTVKEKIGQMLLFQQGSFKKKYIDGKVVNFGDEVLIEAVKKYQPGCFWRGEPTLNIGEERLLAEDMDFSHQVQEVSKYPVLIGADSENGFAYCYSDATETLCLTSIGAADDTELTYQLNKGVCAENRAAGIRWRWSSIIDIPSRFVGYAEGRHFSTDPDRIIRHGIAVMKAAESEGVASHAKHFPGEDPYTTVDGHFSDVCMRMSLEDWEKTQGRTFKGLVDAGVMSIMTTHHSFPAVDDEKINGRYVPTTISKKITTGLLREKLGFKGVIITDDLIMASFNTFMPRSELIIRTVNAGNDALLGVTEEDIETIYKAVEDGRIPMSRIDESCQRILDMKEKIGMFNDEDTPYTDRATARAMIEDANRRISEKALTLLYDRGGLIPVNKEKAKSVAIVYISHNEIAIKNLEAMKDEFESRGAKADVYVCINNNNKAEIFAHDLIIYAGYLSQHNPMGMPSFYGEQMRSFFYAFSEANERSIGLSLGHPCIHIDAMAGANTFINAYSPDPLTLRTFVRAIYGEIPFIGTSPFDIEPKIRYVYC